MVMLRGSLSKCSLLIHRDGTIRTVRLRRSEGEGDHKRNNEAIWG